MIDKAFFTSAKFLGFLSIVGITVGGYYLHKVLSKGDYPEGFEEFHNFFSFKEGALEKDLKKYLKHLPRSEREKILRKLQTSVRVFERSLEKKKGPVHGNVQQGEIRKIEY